MDFFFKFNSIRRIIIFLIFFSKKWKKNFKKITIEDVLEMEAAGPIGNFNDMGVSFEVVALELMLPDPLNPEWLLLFNVRSDAGESGKDIGLRI